MGLQLRHRIGPEALRFAADELGAAEVVAFTEVHNTRSRAVVERLGMVHHGEIRRPGLVEGAPGIHPDAPFALHVTRTAGPRKPLPRTARP